MRLTANCRSQSALPSSCSAPGMTIPALLTRASTPPASSFASSTAARQVSGSDTSPVTDAAPATGVRSTPTTA